MNKSSVIALPLALVPGLGHLYLGKFFRAVFFFAGVTVPILAGVVFAVSADQTFALLCVAFSFFIWVASFVDLISNLTSTPIPAEGSVPNQQQESNTAVLLSIIPGLGHLNLGLTNRGIGFLVLFFGLLSMIFFVAVITQNGGFLIFLVFLPAIWLYSLFDTIQLLQRKQRGEELQDRTIFEEFDEMQESGKRSKLVASLLAIFPGAGHMYLGLQQRGIQLMAAFLLSIYILDTLRLTLFLFLIPIIWFYSFFDALQSAARADKGEVLDEPVIKHLVDHPRWLGIGLLALGIYYLLDQAVIPAVGRWLFPNYNLLLIYERYFQTTLVSILLIGGGLKLLMGSKLDKKGGSQ